MATITERLFGGVGIFRAVGGDWYRLPGGSLRRAVGLDALKVRAVHRAMASKNGWYHLSGGGIGLRDFQGKPLTRARKREVLNRLDLFKRDPAVLDVRLKNATRQADVNGKVYTLVECVLVTTEGELRFTDEEAFKV